MISFFQKSGFRFFFSPSESEAPAHVIIVGRGGQMLVWLDPAAAALAHNLSDCDQKVAIDIVKENHSLLMARWFEWYDSFSKSA